MFEGDKEKYKKFLKNLENALAEADIQKRIREIVRDTKGLAAIDAVEADKQIVKAKRKDINFFI